MTSGISKSVSNETLAEITTVANKYTNSFFLNVVEEPAQTDNNEIFLFPILFWYRLTSIIQFKNSKPTLVNGLYNLYAGKINEQKGEKMSEKVRVTYAQKKLLNLLQERKLKSWCEERNVPHATLYKLATGNIVPSFIVMSSLVPYFAPAEWVYFTDEDIPYEVRTLEVWNPDDTSLFIKKT